MSSSNSSSDKYVYFNIHHGFWILASAGLDENGMTVDLPPVRLVPMADAQALKATIETLLREPLRLGVTLPDDMVGLRARAVGAETWPAFVRAARAFNLILSRNKLRIEEWERRGRSFEASDPPWKIEVKPNELGKALERLLRHVQKT